MIHPNIKAIHLTVPDCPTFQVLWNWQGVDCYFNRFTIKNVKDKIEFQSFQCNEYDEYGSQESWGYYDAQEFNISPEKVEKVNQYFAQNDYPIKCFGYDKILYIDGFESLTNPAKWNQTAFPLEEMVKNILGILWDEEQA